MINKQTLLEYINNIFYPLTNIIDTLPNSKEVFTTKDWHF